MKNINNFSFWTGLISLLIIAYFPLFLHLDALPIRTYDESRLAANAVEMIEQGNPIVTYFAGEPDMWNTKPPLMIWLQSLSILLFGVNELAIRLPAALAGLGVVLLLYLFSSRHLSSPWIGFLGALILLSSHGFIELHVTRSGVYDGLLIFFMTLYSLAFFQFTEKDREDSFSGSLFICGLAIIGATMTKGVAGLLLLPGLFIYAIYNRKLETVLRNRAFYTSFLLFIVIVGGYYSLRESLNPGYLAIVNQEELLGRFLGTGRDHSDPFFLFLQRMINSEFKPWFWLLPLFSVLAVITGGKEKRCVTYLLIVSGTFLLIMSFSQTKLPWYNAPVFPLLSFICGFGLYRIFNALYSLKVRQMLSNYKMNRAVLLMLVIIAIIGPYYRDVIEKVYFPEEKRPEDYKTVRYLEYLNDKINTAELKPLYVVYYGYQPIMEFYKRYFSNRGFPFKTSKSDIIKTTVDSLQKAEQPFVVTCDNKSIQFLQEQFSIKKIKNHGECKIYKVFGKR